MAGKQNAAYNVHLHGPHSVVVNRGSEGGSGIPVGQPRPARSLAGLVTATPLTCTPGTSTHPTPQQAPAIISKILIKVCSRGKKKADSKTFSLRNIDPSSVLSVEKLRSLIRSQLQIEVSQSSNFDVGYLQGSNVVNVRNKEDVLEIWANIKKGANITLWCDGMKQPNKRTRSGDGSSDDEPTVQKKSKEEDRDDKMDSTIKELQEKHGSNTYTLFQYRIWAEMLIGRMATIDHAPTSTMFLRAGGVFNKKRSSNVNVMEAAGSSPAKVIESRTKCYKQLSDLKNMLQSEVLSQEEYDEERATIMGMLHKLV